MKRLILLPLIGLLLIAGQASAACTNIRDSYSGVVPANSSVIVKGPFTITGVNGCRQANISSTIKASGAGSAPDLYIDRLIGLTWTQVAGGTGANASTLSPLGTYRVRHVNRLSVARGYSGTTAYSR